MGKGFKGLIFGGAVGAALGILYAPRAGKKTREILAKKTDALWGEEAQKQGTILGEVAKTTKTAVEAGQNIFNEAQKGKFGEITREATERGQQIFNDTKTYVNDFTEENVRPVFAEKNDELRKKIDIARAKIASQVSQNASSAQPVRTVAPATRKAPVAVKPVSKPAAKPAAKPVAKKTVAKKTTTKAAPKKKVVNKTAAKKAAPKKTTAKKTTAKKPAAKKTTAKKTTAKKTVKRTTKK